MAKLLWSERENMGPSGRYAHAMAFDPVRQRSVLFGGQLVVSATDRPDLSDTWEWDGDQWTQHEVVGPSARFGHATAYDPLRERTVLFGGLTFAPGAVKYIAWKDTWEPFEQEPLSPPP